MVARGLGASGVVADRRRGRGRCRRATPTSAVYAVAAAVLTAVRKEKALAKVSLKMPVESVAVRDTQDRLRAAEPRGRATCGRRATSARSSRPRPRRSRSRRCSPSPTRRPTRRRPAPPEAPLDRARSARQLEPQGNAHGARPVDGSSRSRPPRRPAADLPDDPRHGHERQGTAARVATGDRVRARAHDRPVHLAAPDGGDRAAVGVRRRHDRGGVRRRVRRTCSPSSSSSTRRSEERVTYFEALTALAYLWFADKPVGLGRVRGRAWAARWDATNLVIGRRRRDHADRARPLRSSAPRSPRWRARRPASSRTGKIAVVREQDAEALPVLDERVRAGRCDAAARVPRLGGRGAAARRRRPVVPRAGTSAAPTTTCSCRCSASTPSRNAAAAIVACEALLGEALDGSAAARGARRRALARAARGGRAPAADRARRRPQPGRRRGARRGAPRGLHVGAAAPRDRRHREQGRRGIAGAARPARRRGRTRRATRASAAGDAGPIAEAFAARGVPVARCTRASAEALDAARAAAAPSDLICVTGSLYTVADARRALGP